MGIHKYFIGFLISLDLFTVSLSMLSSYERSFTPYLKNLSCYVCEPASMNLTSRTYVQWEMENKECEEPSEKLIQKCNETDIFKPRGCGKLVTKSYQQINFGGEREVKLVRRFCSSSGMRKEEQKCTLTMSQGRWTEHLKLPLQTTRSPSPPSRRRQTSPTTESVHLNAFESARLVSAIQLGHTNCLRRYILDLLDDTSYRRSSSATISCGNSNLDRREMPPRAVCEWITARRQLFLSLQESTYTTEFEQTSSPLIWAVDCREWPCLRLMCTIQAREQGGPSETTFQGTVYNPSQPQPVRRRLFGYTTGRGPPLPYASQTCVCCYLEGSPRQSGQLALLTHENIPAAFKNRLRPFANVMLSVSFSNLCTSGGHCSPNNEVGGSSPTFGSFLNIRNWKSAQSSPRRSVSPTTRSPCYSSNRAVNSIMLVGCLTTGKHAPRHWKRPMPYRSFWVRGSYTYQSVLDYFFATGYESVGTHCALLPDRCTNCEHCKQDDDYPNYPNYPTGPLDARNEIFFDHFNQLERMLQSSGVSANRLDSVMAFNALSISAGRRLAGWCCHGLEGDPTVGTDPDEPLIEWRILATLIDHGLDEFEWLEFLSPQQNFIGHALCVLAWPMHGWSRTESASLTHHLSRKTSGPLSGFGVGGGSRRIRRRSSSPLEKDGLGHSLPSAPFGAALRRQACLLLINLWSLGAFTSHHIVRRRNGSALTTGRSGSRIWDPRSAPQRSHSYTASMEGGDLRRIMLRTVSVKFDQMGMEPLEFLLRWSYLQALWRSALSGTPLPEPLYCSESTRTTLHHRCHSPELTPYPASPSARNIRTYQPVSLRLLTRRAVRSYMARAEMTRRHGFSSAVTPPLAVPALQRFLGYFHKLEHMLGTPLPKALQILLSLTTTNPTNPVWTSSEEVKPATNWRVRDDVP